MTVINTTCTMDCPDTCALEVHVDDGTITSIRGGASHPTTGGFICSKVARFAERVYHESRLLHPMKRVGRKGEGVFERISWDEAISLVTARFREIRDTFGGESILPYHYGGSNGFLGEELIDELYFARLGASRLARTLCAAPTGEVAKGMYGKMPGVAPQDYVDAKTIIIWGANPRASQIHLMPFVQTARRRGAFVVTIDPRREIRDVDLHLPVRPGTDLPVALAMINLIRERGALDESFLEAHARNADAILDAASHWTVERAAEEAGVDADDIRKMTDRYLAAGPSVIRCGWGLERNRNGGQAVAAILSIPALAGRFEVRGGGYTMSNGGAVKIDRERIIGKTGWSTRVVNMTRLADAILGEELDPPIRGLFVYDCNPVATVPDQNRVIEALEREELFTVVFEQVMTDTCRYADVLLPAVTFLEQFEVKRGYGSYMIGGVQPAIDPRGEAKPNEQVFALLGRAMGFDDAPFSWSTRELLRRVVENVEVPGGKVDLTLMVAGASQSLDFPGNGPVQFGNVFPGTDDARIDLCPPCLGPSPFAYESIVDGYPLALITPANNKMISSTMGEFNYPELRLTLHPADAAARDIEDGDLVRAFNDHGEVLCRVDLSDRIRPGVASMPKGAWMKSSSNERTSTALCPDRVNVVGGGACYNDARIEVEKA
jgi:anaerobic selenocysteine-containing dehydrogenase